jgi:hypothetical protein
VIQGSSEIKDFLSRGISIADSFYLQSKVSTPKLAPSVIEVQAAAQLIFRLPKNSLPFPLERNSLNSLRKGIQ